MTHCKQKRKRNSKELQLLGENTDVARENDVPVNKEQNIAHRLSSKHKFIPIGCIENTGNKKKNFRRSNVENSLFLLMMMMTVELILSYERQIECLSRERLKNEPSLNNLPHGQSTLITKRVAQQVLKKLARDIFDLPGNLRFGCGSNSGS